MAGRVPQYWRMAAVCEGKDKGKNKSQDARLELFSLEADGHYTGLGYALFSSIVQQIMLISAPTQQGKVKLYSVCSV